MICSFLFRCWERQASADRLEKEVSHFLLYSPVFAGDVQPEERGREKERDKEAEREEVDFVSSYMKSRKQQQLSLSESDDSLLSPASPFPTSPSHQQVSFFYSPPSLITH